MCVCVTVKWCSQLCVGRFDFCYCNLDLDMTTFIYELDPYRLKIYRMYENELPMSRLSKLSHYSLRMRAFSYPWSLPVTWKRWRSHHSIRHIRNLTLHAIKPHGSIVYKSRDMAGRIFTHYGNTHFRHFLLLWFWPWPDDLTIPTWPVFPGDIPDVQIWTYRSKFIFEVQGFRKLSSDTHTYSLHTYRETDRQTRPKLYTTPLRGWWKMSASNREQNWVEDSFLSAVNPRSTNG